MRARVIAACATSTPTTVPAPASAAICVKVPAPAAQIEHPITRPDLGAQQACAQLEFGRMQIVGEPLPKLFVVIPHLHATYRVGASE